MSHIDQSIADGASLRECMRVGTTYRVVDLMHATGLQRAAVHAALAHLVGQRIVTRGLDGMRYAIREPRRMEQQA